MAIARGRELSVDIDCSRANTFRNHQLEGAQSQNSNECTQFEFGVEYFSGYSNRKAQTTIRYLS